MFKFIKQYAENINHVDIYPIISLFIFFSFFVVLLVMVKKMKKERIETLSNIPFDKDELTNSNLKNA
ncbi:MAG: CcoQ/FixQ family Cbb3-type cytochrome c oxidase assembly chaperone [Chitinophagaceae bacterium]|nr:CcoQ/FixQ family Cbb3-type cytochrome c oxidase assembly chaperone [Chitinophagaceae bacterium]